MWGKKGCGGRSVGRRCKSRGSHWVMDVNQRRSETAHQAMEVVRRLKFAEKVA
jgi:hypothetical protein